MSFQKPRSSGGSSGEEHENKYRRFSHSAGVGGFKVPSSGTVVEGNRFHLKYDTSAKDPVAALWAKKGSTARLYRLMFSLNECSVYYFILRTGEEYSGNRTIDELSGILEGEELAEVRGLLRKIPHRSSGNV